MRLANLKPAGHPDAECTLIILPGSGGGLLPNLNRWCDQMNQPHLDEEAAQALPVVPLLGMAATLIELEGDYSGMGDVASEGYGLRGIVLPTEAFTIFIKMTGPAEVVRAEADAFDAFCASVRGKSSLPAGHSADDGHDHSGHDHSDHDHSDPDHVHPEDEAAAPTAAAPASASPAPDAPLEPGTPTVSGGMRFELPAAGRTSAPRACAR